MSIIPCTAWVKKGVASTNPTKIQLTPKELNRIIKHKQPELIPPVGNDSDKKHNKVKGQKSEVESSEIDEYNFDKYDDERNIHCNIGNIASFEEDGIDPLITKEDDDSEKDDDIIKSNDNLVLIGRVDGGGSILEVFVYNGDEDSFYCHHDILLPSFPLCLEWLEFDPSDSKPSNLCAIGDMTSIIQVWDLDLIDSLEPAYKLGRKPSKKKSHSYIGHRDAVLDLAWNKNYTHILASASADHTVQLWDLENGVPANKFTCFEKEIQTLKWHPNEGHHLLTGCADTVVRVLDCRYETVVKLWDALGEVEKVLWNSFDTNYCLVSTSNGYIQYMDIRKDKSIWDVQAHTEEVIGLSLSSSCPGLLVSAGNDGVIKVWDIINNKEPCSIWEKKTNLGALLCLAPNPDNPFVFAVGGDNKSHNYKIFDLLKIPKVRERFRERKLESNIKDTKTQEKKEEMMDVTEDKNSIIFNLHTINTASKRMERKV
ncbi:periodic tryptophan protein 1 homolog isoform X2 [Bombus pascuorum]|uniref:periodic tryptophan protein 1 homolog isoform X2 n=1 Tax=Bombus pascuorum TaxID=65598 RepID=UPI00298EBDAB|nr:periodic tryptophan protein 1 homolog isoform X2 [Bombus pascuorum]